MRTQNPPPLKACRFDSDLGHQKKSARRILAHHAPGTSAWVIHEGEAVAVRANRSRTCAWHFRSILSALVLYTGGPNSEYASARI
jgi:hypothetical protein